MHMLLEHSYPQWHHACTVRFAAQLPLTGMMWFSGVKQLEKLIRKRLEEKRKDRAMRKAAQKAEELARGQNA